MTAQKGKAIQIISTRNPLNSWQYYQNLKIYIDPWHIFSFARQELLIFRLCLLTGEVMNYYFVADEQLTNDTVAMILQVNER